MIDHPWMFSAGLSLMIFTGPVIGQAIVLQDAPGTGGFFTLFLLVFTGGFLLSGLSFRMEPRPDRLSDAARARLEQMMQAMSSEKSEK